MGTRKELKKRARLSVKQSYWRAVSVCFLIAMLTTAYPVTTTFFGFHAVSGGILSEPSGTSDLSNSDVVIQIADSFVPGDSIVRQIPEVVLEAGGLVIDICTSAGSLLFSVLRAVNGFILEDPGAVTAFLAAGAVLSLLGHIFISNLLIIHILCLCNAYIEIII